MRGQSGQNTEKGWRGGAVRSEKMIDNVGLRSDKSKENISERRYLGFNDQ